MLLSQTLKCSLLGWGFFVATMVFSVGKIPIVQAKELNWKPVNSETNSLPSEWQKTSQDSSSSSPKKSFSRKELEQTIQALELIKNISPSSLNINQIESVQNQLQELLKERSQSYQISADKIQELRKVFLKLKENQLTAVNTILLLKSTTNKTLSLEQKQIVSLRQFIQDIPSNNLSNLKQKQLIVVQDFLSKIPNQDSVKLSDKQIKSLGKAIDFVFFAPATQTAQTAQIPEITNNKQVSLNQEELTQVINALQAIQKLQLRPDQGQEIAVLLNELEKLQQTTTNIVSLSPETTQKLRTLIGSLSPDKTAAVEFVLLSDNRVAKNLTLKQQEVDELINLFQQIPEQELNNTQIQQRQELIKFLRELQAQEKTEFQLSSTQTQTFLQGIQGFLFGQGETTVSSKRFQEIVTFLETAQKELSLSSSQTETLSRLLRKLDNQQFVISPEQNQQLNNFIDSLNRRQRDKIQRELIVEAGGSVANPAISILNPIGYGNSWGNVGVGASFQERTRFGEKEDGSLSFSMGFGDPEESVGFDATVTVLSVTDENQSAAFSTGSMSFELSRNLPGNSAVSVGVENLIRWPEGSGDTATSTYLVGSSLFQLREDPLSPFGVAYLSVGLGNGRFRSPEAFEANAGNKGFEGFFQVNPFASAAIQVLPRVNAITEWTGQDISIGLSMVPFRESPLVITVAAIDLTGNVEETFGAEGEPRFTAAASYQFFF
ncbi:MAG: hypothetical protein BRC33_00020 [Cyanobacteria bacterium SW_9_44_58]|nr:MAG: hypothetical protein BRC33_00020 [Cyanobacteria bacterium SW_9_44_58]